MSPALFSQQIIDTTITDIGALQFVKPIGPVTDYITTNKQEIADKDIPAIIFEKKSTRFFCP